MDSDEEWEEEEPGESLSHSEGVSFVDRCKCHSTALKSSVDVVFAPES